MPAPITVNASWPVYAAHEGTLEAIFNDTKNDGAEAYYYLLNELYLAASYVFTSLLLITSTNIAIARANFIPVLWTMLLERIWR